MKPRLFCLLFLIPLLAACDLLGVPDPAKEAEQKDAEGKAIGGACRHAGRALEDCFALNANAKKASIFAGWKDMNDYMAQNKIETVKPDLIPGAMLAAKKTAQTDESAPEEEEATSEDSAPSTRKSRLREKPSSKTNIPQSTE